MTDVFVEMLRSWQNFYFMTGGAAAALIGLMFVALSLGMNIVSKTTQDQFSQFVLPSIVYFVSALILSMVMLNPVYTPLGLEVVLFVGGAIGLWLTLRYVRALIRTAKQHGDFDLTDWLAQIIFPVVNYALIVAAAVGLGVNQWELAFTGLWIASILLLLSAILNTWSLVVWIVEHRVE